MLFLVAWLAMIFGAMRWYLRLDEVERGPVEVASGILLIVGSIFTLLIAPFLIVDWVQERKREAHRRWLQEQPSKPR